jgi:hypothetical protein
MGSNQRIINRISEKKCNMSSLWKVIQRVTCIGRQLSDSPQEPKTLVTFYENDFWSLFKISADLVFGCSEEALSVHRLLHTFFYRTMFEGK